MLDYNFLLKKYCSRYDCDCINNTYEGISWRESKVKKPSEEQFQKWWKESQTEYQNYSSEQQKISSLRRSEYPSIDEMVVALWELIIEERTERSTELQNIRRLVKEKYQTFVPEQSEDDQINTNKETEE